LKSSILRVGGVIPPNPKLKIIEGPSGDGRQVSAKAERHGVSRSHLYEGDTFGGGIKDAVFEPVPDLDAKVDAQAIREVCNPVDSFDAALPLPIVSTDCV